jgi:hypothetical protein
MADRYTETTTTGYGTNLMESFKGLIFGPLLLIAGIVVLWLNEGRINDGKLAMSSITIDANKPNQEAQEKLVSLSGEIVASEPIGDSLFLNPANYIKLIRKVEVYAWEEKISKKEETKLGGSKTTETTYDYQKTWLEGIPSSSNFKYKEEHENPKEMPFKTQAFFPEKAKIGLYTLNPSDIKFGAIKIEKITQAKESTGISLTETYHTIDTSKLSPIKLNNQNLIDPNEKIIDDFIFKGKGTLTSPEVGDIRISFYAIPSPSNVTVFGKLSEQTLVPYFYNSHEFYRLNPGDKTKAIAEFKAEHKLITWLYRLLGFILVFVGIFVFFNPFITLLSFIPILSNFTMNLVGFVAFVVALIISSVVIIVSMIAHNIWVLLTALLILLVLFIVALVIKARRKKSMSTASV